MDQISANVPTKTSLRNTNIALLDNSISTETLVNNINIEILVNSIKPDPSKDIENLQSYTLNKFS